jgi:hypothetical protein
MNEIVPTSAYNLLEPLERVSVDEYVNYAVEQQLRLRQSVSSAINKPIPNEFIRKSRNSLYKPLLRVAINERINEIARSRDLSPDRVIEEHAKIAFSEITDYMEAGFNGELTVRDFDTIPKSRVGAVKSIETKPGSFGMSMKITMHDKLPSLKLLGELMGMTSPDAQPPLKEYVSAKVNQQKLEIIPEKAYMELLETCSQL